MSRKSLKSQFLVLTAAVIALAAWSSTAPTARLLAKSDDLPAIAPLRSHLQAESPQDDDLLDQILAAGKLVVSTDPNYAPWSVLHDQGELVGFDVDVAEQVATRLGVGVEYITPDWDWIIGGHWNGRWPPTGVPASHSPPGSAARSAAPVFP